MPRKIGSVHERKTPLGRELTTMRLEQSLSLEDAAEISGVGKTCISNTEKGVSDPCYQNLVKIVESYGYEIEFMKVSDDEK
jgi:transcriptional regulator with XRE-family HTH domain